MEFIQTGFDGLIELIPGIFRDARGYFLETFHKNRLAENGIDLEIMQINQSYSQKGVIRGLHLQVAPHSQAKLVRVLSGKVLDVVLDIRTDSETFGKHYKCTLDSERRNMLYVPEGFAHGFAALEDSLFQYDCSTNYQPAAEMGILWNDPELAIDWQIKDPIISEKDLSLPRFKDFLELV